MKTLILFFAFSTAQLMGWGQVVDTVAMVREVDSLIQVSRGLTAKRDFEKALMVNAATEKLVLEKLGRETAAYGSVCFNHGRVLVFKGDFPEAEKWYLESKTIREKALGKEHSDYAHSLNNLAALYGQIGNYEKSESLHLQALAIREKVLGKEHLDYAASLNNLALLYHDLGQYEKAEPLHIEAKNIREKVLGKEHPDYAATLNNLALLYSDMGNYEKAEPLYIEAVAIKEKSLGKEHPAYANSLNNLALLYKTTGHYEKTEMLYLKVKAIREKVLGKEHPDYAATLNNLALLYSDMANYEKAEPLHLEAKAIREKILGKLHPDYAKSLHNLALLYSDMGNYEKAEMLYLDAKAIREKILHKEHPDYATNLNNLGILYRAIGNYGKAELFHLEAIAIRGKTLGEWHPDYAASLNNLALLYSDMGNYEKAEPLYIEAISIQKKALGKEHPGRAGSLNNLALLYSNMGNYEKAEPLYIEAITLKEKVWGKEHPNYASSLNNLAVLYYNLGNYKKAEMLYSEAIAIEEKTLGKEHPDYAQSLNNLALLYSDMGNYEKAKLLYFEAKTTWEKVLGKEHPHYATSLINLALLYYTMGNYETVEPLYLEAKAIKEKILGKEHPEYGSTLNNLVIFYWKTGKPLFAELLVQEANGIEKSLILKASKHLSEREMLSYLRLFEKKLDRNYSFIQTFTPSGFFGDCFDNTLFHKSFLLNTSNQIRNQVSGDSALIEKLNLYKSYHRRLAAQYSKPIAERDSVKVAELEEKANTLEKELVRTVAGFGDALRQVTWQEVQAQLKPDEVAIEFVHYDFYTPDKTDSVMYAALVLRPGWKQPLFIPLFEEKSLLASLHFDSDDRRENINSNYGRDSGGKRSLYQLLWEPLRRHLKGVRSVYFSPSGLLHRINLGAVSVSKKQVLADRYNLVQVGSTRQLVVPPPAVASEHSAQLYGGVLYRMDSTAITQADSIRQKEASTASRGELSFSYTDSTLRSGYWTYLAGTAQEVDTIGKILGKNGMAAITLKEYAATEKSFKQIGQAKPSPRILHIATHGFFFPDPASISSSKGGNWGEAEPVFKISEHPMIRSGLLLAGANHAWQTGKPLKPEMEDGILTAYEISQMNLRNTELVVLSACETGLGDIQGNEGVYGLQRAFKIAGAKHLIMSLWKVPDQETARLMTAFYKKWLEQKMPIPEAFKSAQKEMREAGLEPYYWAGFVLVE